MPLQFSKYLKLAKKKKKAKRKKKKVRRKRNVKSEVKKSQVFTKGLIQPVRFKMEAKQVSPEIWEFKHTEWFHCEDELLEKAIEVTKIVAESFGFKVDVKKNKLSMKVRGTLDQALSGMLTEILSLSSVGDMTLRDLIISAGLGKAIFKRLKSAPSAYVAVPLKEAKA
jgi:hypothetical protein